MIKQTANLWLELNGRVSVKVLGHLFHSRHQRKISFKVSTSRARWLECCLTVAEVSALKVTVTMGHEVYGELNSPDGCSLSSSGSIDAGGRWKSHSSRLFKTVVFKNLPQYSPYLITF